MNNNKILCPNGCGKKLYVMPNGKSKELEAHLKEDCGGAFQLSFVNRNKLRELRKRLEERKEVNRNGE